MKVRDTDIIIVPGFAGSGPDHWQSRWEEKLSTARRVEMEDWNATDRDLWTGAVTRAVNKASKPVLLIGHSLGVAAILGALDSFTRPVAGAFLVAAPDMEGPSAVPGELRGFGAYSRSPLPFPTLMVASRNDQYAGFEFAEELAAAWGALLVDAGEAGHINADAGYGPWPEGSMAFASFLAKLPSPV